MKVLKSIIFSLSLILSLTAQAQSSDHVVVIKSVKNRNNHMKITHKADGYSFFQMCNMNVLKEECSIIGRTKGYSDVELETRVNDLKSKQKYRIAAKIVLPILGFAVGAAAGTFAAMNTGAVVTSSEGVYVIFLGLLAGAGGVASSYATYVLVDKYMPEYEESAKKLAEQLSTKDNTNQKILIVEAPIAEVISQITYAVSGIKN